MTICPASVPVIVDDCPEAMSATAKATGAIAAPRIGSSSRCASWISATSVRPARWNVAAAITSSAALTKNAPFNATTESITLNFSPLRMPVGVRTIRRD